MKTHIIKNLVGYSIMVLFLIKAFFVIQLSNERVNIKGHWTSYEAVICDNVIPNDTTYDWYYENTTLTLYQRKGDSITAFSVYEINYDTDTSYILKELGDTSGFYGVFVIDRLTSDELIVRYSKRNTSRLCFDGVTKYALRRRN